ncbi:hypothetical protein [Sphaerisporangium dianthi]|uniref:Uncharacterized protein n=1 Tax=Sphaerisporangium dianthi TaxID=1436120 RepID=A0ABV9CD55_9ACTN
MTATATDILTIEAVPGTGGAPVAGDGFAAPAGERRSARWMSCHMASSVHMRCVIEGSHRHGQTETT